MNIVLPDPKKIDIPKSAQVNIEVNFEERIKMYDELLKILHEKLDYYQKIMKEDKFSTPLEKIEMKEKIWHLKVDCDAKLNYLTELVLRKNKK